MCNYQLQNQQLVGVKFIHLSRADLIVSAYDTNELTILRAVWKFSSQVQLIKSFDVVFSEHSFDFFCCCNKQIIFHKRIKKRSVESDLFLEFVQIQCRSIHRSYSIFLWDSPIGTETSSSIDNKLIIKAERWSLLLIPKSFLHLSMFSLSISHFFLLIDHRD